MSKLGYVLNKYHLLEDYKRGRLVCGGTPFIHSIEPTNKCNLACPMCNRDEDKTRGTGSMSLSRFNEILQKYGDCFKALALFFHGEPLLNPDLAEMVSLSVPLASTVNITTNGTLLDSWIAKALMMAGLYSLTISYEGESKDVYEGVRRGADYEKTTQNILNAIDIRDLGEYRTKINLAYVLMDNTKLDIQAYREKWLRRGVNGFRFIPLHGWGLEKNRELGDTTGLRRTNVRCLAPWFGFHVAWNGDVIPCCLWGGSKTDPYLGNVFEANSMEELWNSSGYQWFRREHLSGCRKIPRCRGCRIDPYTEAISLNLVEELMLNPLKRRLGVYASRLQG